MFPVFKGIFVSRGAVYDSLGSFCQNSSFKNRVNLCWTNRFLNSEISASQHYINSWYKEHLQHKVWRLAASHTTGKIYIKRFSYIINLGI